jgi:hypothetical protein
VAEDGTHYIAITKLLPHAIAAIQELHKSYETQAEEQEELEERVSTEGASADRQHMFCFGARITLVERHASVAKFSVPCCADCRWASWRG